jgi:hypothetical protein
MKQTYDCHKSSCKHVNSKRTIDQNSALHLYCAHVAQELNGAGWSIKKALAYYKVDLDWDMMSVKELIWRPIQIALLGKKSTSDLNKSQDITQVYEHINRFLSNPPFSIHVPFPNNPDKAGSKTAQPDKLPTPYPEDYSPPLL